MKRTIALFVIWGVMIVLPISVALYTIETAVTKQIIVVNTIACLYALVAVMAIYKKRNALMWVLISLIATPLMAVFLLYLIEDDERVDDEQEKVSYYGDRE
jgi:hypothetical protein